MVGWWENGIMGMKREVSETGILYDVHEAKPKRSEVDGDESGHEAGLKRL